MRLGRSPATYPASIAALCLAGALAVFVTLPARAQGPPACSNPIPTAVAVDAVPIVVTSTTDDYFVLYAGFTDDGTAVESPVAVVRGQAGTTTLEENVAALPKERYRVEKYLVADPADVDGDCIDDITELDNLGSMNPVNPAGTIDLEHGALAIVDRGAYEALSYEAFSIDLPEIVKFVLPDLGAVHQPLYFMNTEEYPGHGGFLEFLGLQVGYSRGELVYVPHLADREDGEGLSYFFQLAWGDDNRFENVSRVHALIAASLPLLDGPLGFRLSNRQLRYLQSELPLFWASRIPLVFDEELLPEADSVSLNAGDRLRPAAGRGAGRAAPSSRRRGLRGAAQQSPTRGRHHQHRGADAALARQPPRHPGRCPQRLHPGRPGRPANRQPPGQLCPLRGHRDNLGPARRHQGGGGRPL